MDSLPNEIVLQIFENLAYEDLKFTIPMISKRFRSLVSDAVTATPFGRIAQLLFRDIIPVNPSIISMPTAHTIHPAFKDITFTKDGISAEGITACTQDDRTFLVELDLDEIQRDLQYARSAAMVKPFNRTYISGKRFFWDRDDLRKENCVTPASNRIFLKFDGLFPPDEYFDCYNPNSVAATENLPLRAHELVPIILFLLIHHAISKADMDGLVQTAANVGVDERGVAAVPNDTPSVDTESENQSKPKRSALYAYVWHETIGVETTKDRVILTPKVTYLGLQT